MAQYYQCDKKSQQKCAQFCGEQILRAKNKISSQWLFDN